MHKAISILTAALLSISFFSCGGSYGTRRIERTNPLIFIKPNEPIAIMPFETENALSNLGGHLSDELIVELFEQAPNIKIIPGTVVRNYLQTAGLTPVGLLDEHAIHNVKEGLKCRYLLTGNLYTSIGDVRYTQSYSNRIASGSVTVRLVDCDSMTIVWAKHIESSYSTSTYYISGGQQYQGSYLTDGQMLQGLMKNLAGELARQFYQ